MQCFYTLHPPSTKNYSIKNQLSQSVIKSLFFLDVSIPSAPVIASSLPLSFSFLDLALSGSHAYATSEGKLYAIDLLDPGSPSVIDTLEVLGTYWSRVSVAGSRAYVHSLDTQIIDVSDPLHLKLVGSIEARGEIQMAFQGNHAYLVTTNSAEAPRGTGSS